MTYPPPVERDPNAFQRTSDDLRAVGWMILSGLVCSGVLYAVLRA